MACFFDRPELEESYKRQLLHIMPDIKKSRHCELCLSSISYEVEPLYCPYLKELFEGISCLDFDKNPIFFDKDKGFP